MKILVVTQYFYPETFRVNSLCTELVKRGHDVTVLTGFPQYPQGEIYDGYGFNKEYEHEWNGAKIERLKVLPRGKTPIGLLLNCITFVREGKKWVKNCTEKFDAVYVFEVSPVTVGLPAVEYKEKFGTPVFFNVQDLWPENVEVVLGIHNKLVINLINKIVDKIYSASDKILCSSNGFVEDIKTRGVPAEKLVFWPQFCDEPDFTNAEKPEIYSDDDFKIVFAGNIGEAQGLDLLLETADCLKDCSDIKFYIVGDGRARKRLEETAKANGLQNVFFVGKVSVDAADRYIHFADCAYLSFKDNAVFNMTIPAKLQSYMACGTPILAAAGGESAEIIKKADCGFISTRNSAELSEIIKQITCLHDKIAEMGKNAYEFYSQNFKKENTVDYLENIMSNFVSGNAGGEFNR